MDALHNGLHQFAQALFDLTLWAAIIQFAGALIVTRSVVAATLVLLRTRDTVRARLTVAQGVLWVLSFTLAATLLAAVLVHTWMQILTFAVVVAFCVALKRVFAWEQSRLLAEPGDG
jgi:hypothetical protein